MRLLRPLALATTVVFLSGSFLCVSGQRKKKKKGDEEPPTQTLELPPDPPNAVIAETSRLSFDVAPMSAKGLLSQQVRDGLKALSRQTRGDQIVKLRAFVAGTGDLRRVQTIVSETFAEKRLPLPALTVIQVGALPMEGAQVVLESVSVEKKPAHSNGLAFISGQQVVAEEPTLQMLPLVEKSIGQLRTALAASGIGPTDALRVTCFLTSLDDYPKSSQLIAQHFPQAARTIVQLQRAPARSLAECEAVAHLQAPPAEPVKLLNPEGLPKSENYSQVALVGPQRVALTGSQLAFRLQPDDARLAFQRLEKTLEGVRTSMKHVVMANFYPLSQRAADLIRNHRFEHLDKERPPASTLLLFEGLPSLDASFSVEVLATVPEPAATQ